MDKREILQIAGAKLGCSLPDLFDYYSEQSMNSIRKMVRGLVQEGHLKFSALESNGFYLTPGGLKFYEENKP